ncbi:hypothetical protein KP763_04260 [Streptococcus equi subsp. equi]|uniref:hypothetical protein n=1 Tax=Streptococcus equi TaxID=1336 RepID=UPI001E35896E|nr:hypothetical protein [Streptococcus equi]MCD3473237.1 hypothetical protein [Streptococcus equi subsp. equi]MCD3499024.1 hypothetical protein [Streptococcus equi subsp. equi]
MYYYLILLGVILVFCYLEYSDKKYNYEQAKRLNSEFDKWIKTHGKSNRPSNAVFSELYKKCYKKETHGKSILKGNRAIVMTNHIDIVKSFPSTNTAILLDEYTILENLLDYYELEISKVTSVNYFIHFIISLPLKALRYIGIDDSKNSSRLFQVITWIVGLFIPLLKELMINFIRFLIHSK